MPHLGLDFLRGVEGICNFAANQFPVALAQPMHGDFHGAFIHTELHSERGIRLGLAKSQKRWLEGGEQLRLAIVLKFEIQSVEHFFEQSHGPLLFEDFVRRGMDGRLEFIAFFGGRQF